MFWHQLITTCLCHGDNGFGDYIIFSVNESGQIDNYVNRLDAEDWIDEAE
jgi:hypothetical protein